MNSDLLAVLEYMERDKGISREVLIEAIESSIQSAARRSDEGPARDLTVTINPKTGEIRAIANMVVVEKVKDPREEISLSEARLVDPKVKEGDEIRMEFPPEKLGRIAAQTAKQVVTQKIRDAEKGVILDTYRNRVGELVSGVVRRIEKQNIYVDLGRTEAVMPPQEQCPHEEYRPGMRLRAILVEVRERSRGPEIVFSRTHPDFVRRLFEMEVPEIEQGVVKIKAIAREPGYRTKIAVDSEDPRVDCVGACVGVRGARVKSVVRELNGEKIDIIRWDKDPVTYITNALSPAKLKQVTIDPATKEAEVIVDEDQLSLAIGRKGQNVRLSSRLTEWKVDIFQEGEVQKGMKDAVRRLCALPGMDAALAQKLVEAGFVGIPVLAISDPADLVGIAGIEEEKAREIVAAAQAVAGPGGTGAPGSGETDGGEAT